MTEEIKQTTYFFTQKMAKGENVYNDYLKWFSTLPEELKSFALQTFEIFEQLSFKKITVEDAKERWILITNKI